MELGGERNFGKFVCVGSVMESGVHNKIGLCHLLLIWNTFATCKSFTFNVDFRKRENGTKVYFSFRYKDFIMGKLLHTCIFDEN